MSADVFDPRPNILAGTAWLKAMYERFDSLFAAYKADQVENPGRYAAHLRDGKPFPAETRTYVAGTREAPGATPETTVTHAKTSPLSTQNSPKIAFDTWLFLPISTRETVKIPHEMASFSCRFPARNSTKNERKMPFPLAISACFYPRRCGLAAVRIAAPVEDWAQGVV